MKIRRLWYIERMRYDSYESIVTRLVL